MNNRGDSHLADYPEPSHLSRQRLNVLRARVTKSVVGSSPGATAGLINELIQTAIEAFICSRGDVHGAVKKVAPLAHRAGVREASRHPDPSRIDQSFKLASVAVQRGLPIVVGDLMTRDSLQKLRQDLAAFMNQLYRIARAGFDRTIRVAAMSQDDCLAELRAVAFKGAAARDVDQMAAAAGLDPSARFVSVVAVYAPLPDSLREHPQTLMDDSSMQALIPEDWDQSIVAEVTQTQVVLGPPSALGKAYEGVVLTSSAASILRDGAVLTTRDVIPSTDLLGELLVRGNPLLADLLVEKHLWPLESLPVQRRMALSEMLLLSLERGLPLNRVARDLGIASQTAHNRMKALRNLLGDKIDDADQRLELIVALRSARFRWAEE